MATAISQIVALIEPVLSFGGGGEWGLTITYSSIIDFSIKISILNLKIEIKTYFLEQILFFH